MTAVSIIVPIYKTKPEYLEKMVSSVANQELKDFEVLMVIDGKDPAMRSLCEQLCGDDAHFRIFEIPHGGVSAARNFGIQQAQGQYVSFIDADDWITPSVYSSAYSCAVKNDSDVVFWNMVVVDACGKYDERRYAIGNINNLTEEQRADVMSHFVWANDPKYTAIVSVCCKLVRRDFMSSENALFNRSIAIGEDRVFFSRLFQNAKKISYLDEYGYFYFEHSDSAMHNFNDGGLTFLTKYLFGFDKSLFETNKFAFGREAYNLLMLSWDKCYMHPANPNSYFARMSRLSRDIKVPEYRSLLSFVDVDGLSVFKKLEIALLKRGVTFTVWCRGLKKLFLGKKN